MAGGRPTTYNEDIAKKICDIVATHTQGLKKLCEMYDFFPDYTTIALWRLRHPEFSNLYLEAKKNQMDLAIEELDEHLDNNLLYYTDEKGNERIDSPSATIAIAKANNRKWFASKIAPKLYGDRTQNEITVIKHEDKLKELE
tara:strand:+ start:808 stop:1233 length:426 start_codon:yes stop_codon:yes gene_type:complete